MLPLIRPLFDVGVILNLHKVCFQDYHFLLSILGQLHAQFESTLGFKLSFHRCPDGISSVRYLLIARFRILTSLRTY